MNRTHLAVAVIALVYALGLGVSAVTAPPGSSAQIGSADGPTLVTASGRPAPGVVERYHANGTLDWRLARWHGVFGVQRLDGGRVLLAYQNASGDCDRYAECHITGVQIWTTPPNATLTWHYRIETRAGLNREVHDANYYPDTNTVTLVDMDRERLLVINRSTKGIVWQWNASAFYTPPPDPTKRDWLHINDVDRLAHGRYLVSVRNANQLLVVERGAGVVEVINADRDDGDDGVCRGIKYNQLYGANPRCGDPAVLNGQHDPQWLGPGRVLVADSVNDRVVELARRGGEWRVVWSLETVAGQRLRWPRDANRLPTGHTLIADVRGNRVVQVNKQGRVVFQLPQNEELYAALRNGSEYPAGPPAARSNIDANPRGQPLQPPLQSAVRGLRYAGVAPVWFTGWHLSAGVVVAVLVVGTVITTARERWGES